MSFIWLGEKISLKYIHIGSGEVFLPMSRRCRHRLCRNWLRKKINKCSKNELTKVLTSRKEMIVNVIKNDELEVTDELIVYQAVRNWIRHDVKNRAKVILYSFCK